MKKFVFFILFFVPIYFGIGIFSNAQSSLPKNVSDSLWAVWLNPAEPDTARMLSMYEIAWEGYLYTRPDSTYYYASLLLNFAEEKGYKRQMANALYAMGISLFYRGENSSAIIHFTQSLELNKEADYKPGVSNTLSALGVVYSEQGDFNKAIDFYSQSLVVLTETGNKPIMASTLNNIGSIYVNKGDYAIAMEYFVKSKLIYEEIGSQRGIANVTSNIGNIYLHQGDYVRALENFSICLKVKEDRGEKKGIASASLNIGIVYMKLGRYQDAIENYTKSILIQEEIGDLTGLVSAIYSLGVAKRDLAEYDHALTHLLRVLKIQEELDDSDGLCGTLNAVGLTYQLQNDFDTSIHYCKKSLELAEKLGYLDLIQNASRSLYLNYIAIAKPNEALTHLTILKTTISQALSVNYFTLSEREKELYFSTMEPDFNRYNDFTLFYHNQFTNLPDTAYNLALQNKGLALKSSTAMRTAIISSGDDSLISDYEKWILLRRKIANLYSSGNDTRSLENEADELEKELAFRSNAFSDFDKIKKLNWQQVQASLKSDECAIEFVNFKSEIDPSNATIYVALLIRTNSNHPEVIRLCTEDELAAIFGTIEGNNIKLINRIYGTKTYSQTALYNKIWQPLEKYLDGVKTIYYSPSGLLHKISFASISKKQNVFLSDIYNFRQMSSTGKVAMADDISFTKDEKFFLMGGVNYNTEKTSKEIWQYLPGSLQETDGINLYLQKEKYAVNYFDSADATEEIFKEKIAGSSIVHIATHGFFYPDPEKIQQQIYAESESNKELIFRGSTNYANWSFVNNKNPLMRSGIILAQANDVWEREALAKGEDGILTAQEVSSLDLSKTKLVVLSACETGLGDIHGSEGVYGLQRAFKMAGVKYLIMSLWQVPDKETSEFMILFYKNLIKEKDIPLAFNKTQKVMRQKYDPYYWGAFVLIE